MLAAVPPYTNPKIRGIEPDITMALLLFPER